MALIVCPDCCKEYSDTADCCPNCGYNDFIDEHKTEGIASIIIGVFSWIIMLLIPFLSVLSLILFIVSLFLQRKCETRHSFWGFAISSLGLLAIILGFVI